MKLWVSVQVDCLFGEDAIKSFSLLRLTVRKQNSTPSSKWDCRKEFNLILELSSDKDKDNGDIGILLQLDPVGSTVLYEMMKLRTGSV